MPNLFDFELTPEQKREMEKLKNRAKYQYYSQRQLEFYHRNREELKAQYREYYRKTAGKRRERYRENPEKQRAYTRERNRKYLDIKVAWNLNRSLEKIEKSTPRECARGKVTSTLLEEILKEEVRGRVLNYLKNDNMKKKIMCIVGESGTGKTLCSLHLKNYLGANVICSYTTRPPRKTEVEGREHHFIDIEPPKSEMLAYAVFGGHKYYATKAQVQGECTVYVIDEKGVRNMREMNADEFDIYTVYLKRDKQLRILQGIDTNRMNRDNRRERIDESEYDYVVVNNGTKAELFNNIERIYNEIKNK